ncbi:hypothetical protein DHEL01_v206794 [Diaporthe helianthi]|uniref:Uncharacterized protein n=1 Tax=Diaporthe helianthi TaxID=158607 RepID=A0A2P5HX31_DIAHE|nr:hypothetical protein DHEL01_v206794 [Diaporthe helianthi]
MESSAPKRRKTSPTSSVPVESTTPPGPPPSQPTELQTTPESTTRSIGSARQTTSNQSEELPASQPDFPEDDAADISNASPARLEQHSERDGGASSSAAQPEDVAATAQNAPLNTGESEEGSLSRSPVKRAGGTTLGAQPARHSPSRPQPRPLPPPAPENEEDLFNPFVGRALQRSPLNTGVIPVVAPPPEPELPPTPHHVDPVVSTPPSGIHNSPSKRRRQGNVGRLARQESPSKGPPRGDFGLPQKESQKPRVFRVARRGSPVGIIEQDLPAVQVSGDKNEKDSSEFARGTHPRRSIRLNPLAQKQKERDELLREVAKLEADLELATRNNQAVAKGVSSLEDRSEIMDLFRRHLLPAQEDQPPDAATQWLETAMNPIAMLGFNGSSSAFLLPPVPQEEEEPESPPVSHHPIPMSSTEELPYLQVFTPLTFTTKSINISAPSDHGDPTLKKLTIRIGSATPPGLFVSIMEMIVNTRTLAVSSLAVPKLDPAAAGELQSFVEKITSSRAPPHSALTRNVSVLSWAISEWYRVALKRAKFWHALEKQLGPEAKDGLPEVVRAMRTRKRRRKRARGEVDDVGASFESTETASNALDSMLLSKADLLPHMGRLTMDLSVPYLAEEGTGAASELRVSWRIEFDWTGEARSKLGVDVGVPGKWHASDERKSITKIPTVFDSLVQGGEDPLTATKTVVALLAGEPAS